MRPPALRVLLSVPVLIVLGLTGQAGAQHRPWAFGVGIGYGYGAGPYWGVMPFYYDGFYGPYADGYWGPDAAFYYRGGDGRFLRDNEHHFRRDRFGGARMYHSRRYDRDHDGR